MYFENNVPPTHNTIFAINAAVLN